MEGCAALNARKHRKKHVLHCFVPRDVSPNRLCRMAGAEVSWDRDRRRIHFPVAKSMFGNRKLKKVRFLRLLLKTRFAKSAQRCCKARSCKLKSQKIELSCCERGRATNILCHGERRNCNAKTVAIPYAHTTTSKKCTAPW